MKRTGGDISHSYKETSLGGLAVGLAVNRVECLGGVLGHQASATLAQSVI